MTALLAGISAAIAVYLLMTGPTAGYEELFPFAVAANVLSAVFNGLLALRRRLA